MTINSEVEPVDGEYLEILRKIEELQAENEAMKIWQEQTLKLLNKMLDTIEQQKKDLRNIQQYVFINRIRIESLPYEMRDTAFKSKIFIPNILSKPKTRRTIIDKHKCFSRFGDGEFAIIAGVGRWNFQAPSEKLADKLKNVLKSDEEGILLGLQKRFYGNLENLSETDADGVRAYMRPEVREMHAKLLDPDRIYGDALIHEIKTQQDTDELREIWENKDCVFIEGEHTGMGVGNNLFDNAKSIGRIIAPAENAIDKYEEIMNAATKISKNKLILLALGPTATALAYDLYKEGYWAIDIGHIDLYYEKFVRGLNSIEDVNISYKYCSWDEIGERRQIDKIIDPVYEQQIIEKVI